jgi:ribonuclease P protein subunit RPR2
VIRLLLCDDASSARELARVLLEAHPAIEIVGEAANGEEAVVRAAELAPDVVLMDVEMPVLDGATATQRIRELLPATRIVAHAGSDDTETVMRMIEAGATAYCVKGASPWELERAIVGAGDPLVRLAHALARSLGETVKAELVARELAELTRAPATAVYLVSSAGEIVPSGRAGGATVRPDHMLADAARRACTDRSLVVDAGIRAVPLLADGELLGALVVASADEPRPDVELLASIADLAAASIASDRRLALIRAEARRDALTGLPNRRAFDEALDDGVAAALATPDELSIVLLDLDDFKRINDTGGHAAGDDVLRRIGVVLRRTIRADEVVFRIGGEEFAVVVNGGREAALRVGERVRAALRGDLRGQPLPTVSAGLATLPGDATERDELLRRADAALYAAKWAGKDRVLAYGAAGHDAADAATAAESIAFPIRRSEDQRGDDQVLVSTRDLRRLLQAERGQRAQLRDAYRETIAALTAVLESKDVATGAHSQRVQRYALELAGAVDPGLLADESLEYGFLLHDVGKIGIPDRVLLKPGPLTRTERGLMQTHSILGEQLLENVALVQGDGLRVVRSHHERWDGGGYPDGLERDAIPLGARIFAVADTLDAMTSGRPYRPAGSWDAAVSEIVSEAGRQFDPDVVDAFRACEKTLRQSCRPLAQVS